MSSPKKPSIEIKGASLHNLKKIDIDIPLNRFTVVTGVSGSGKSSLVFDTLYAEGQRRYIETFSPYARQFMERMDRPAVESIKHIPPAIAIDRTDPVRTSRSTVGTMTDLTDYMKILFSRIAVLHCHKCGLPVIPAKAEIIRNFIDNLENNTEVLITFPKISDDSENILKNLSSLGFTRFFINNSIIPAENFKFEPESEFNVIIDRVIAGQVSAKRILESIEQAFLHSGGKLDIWVKHSGDKNEFVRTPFSINFECPACHIEYKSPTQAIFSFNNPLGACGKCRGFGRIIDIDPDLIIPDSNLSIADGAIKPWGNGQSKDNGFKEQGYKDLINFCSEEGIPVETPFSELKPEHKKALFDGTPSYYGIKGFFDWLETKTYKMHVRVFLSRYRAYSECPSCHGTRFKPETLHYRLYGKTIAEIYSMTVGEAVKFFTEHSDENIDEASALVHHEIILRLNFLSNVGLNYLTLDRQSRTLSGGEVQRVALASSISSSLVSTLYVLDEPSIGLHPRDNHRLLSILSDLRDLGNTVVVVEHDPDIIRAADHMVDIGPEAGGRGGNIIFEGPVEEASDSPTGEFLNGKKQIPLPSKRRKIIRDNSITIKGISANNLKNIDVTIPLGVLTCITGVSGSGKSTVVMDVIYRAIKWMKGIPDGHPGQFLSLDGHERIHDVIMVDQQPIGRTSRANALTYTKAMDDIRKLFAKTPEAKKLGLKEKHFSFNTDGGRCELCKGDGFEKIEMQFLSDVFVTCPSCLGKKYKEEILAVTFKGCSIYDVLSMTLDESLIFFSGYEKITRALTPLSMVGLGYITLGQSVSTLSGGEAQRLKLSSHFGNSGNNNKLFIFDEPTTGLHLKDTEILITAINNLVDKGNSVLVVEHNMEFVKTSDWVIDLGPEGGDEGGYIIAEGTPELISDIQTSYTGKYLKKVITDSYHNAEFLQTNIKIAAEAPLPYITGHKALHALDNNDNIVIYGAREHNLKNIQVTIPRNKFVCLSGVSGSGKSTLAFDIIFAEGQRRYLESLTPYVRQYVRIMERPDVDSVTGLPPSVAIEQRVSHSSSRSTVATLTEIYHFLRILFSKVGQRYCYICGKKLTQYAKHNIIKKFFDGYNGEKIKILVPKAINKKGFHKEILSSALKKGCSEVRIDGIFRELTENILLDRYKDHTIEVVLNNNDKPPDEALIKNALEEGEGIFVAYMSDKNEEAFSLHGTCPTCGIATHNLDPRLFSFNSPAGLCPVCNGLGTTEDGHTCIKCNGSRIRPEALAVKIGGHTIWDMVRIPAGELKKTINSLNFNKDERLITDPVISEIIVRLSLLDRLGLSYLSLSRSGNTLSGGEAQRVKLASQLGSNLTGVCYVLDEPTIGLHPRDNHLLIETLKELRDRGNSVIVVEHDEETIRAADHIIDMGPEGGESGGEIIAEGTIEDIIGNARSSTGKCLKHKTGTNPDLRRPWQDAPKLTVANAGINNLKNFDVEFPLGTFICITGVSGSGKSSLLKNVVYNGLNILTGHENIDSGNIHNVTFSGWEQISRVIEVDHTPIGRTSRSNPASYIDFYSDIRTLLSLVPESRRRGYAPKRFSFNVSGGRCEECGGHGHIKVEMAFLPDVYVRCEECEGRRFNSETLSVTYKGKNIYEILDLSFEEAKSFFAAVPAIVRPVSLVCDIGLGYLKLGQPSPTLSGGEAQRIKLAKELVKSGRGHTFYILDEPSTGLHMNDVKKVTSILQALVDAGNTVAVIEHNMDIISEADYIIDLGPEGGELGGAIVATGSPEELSTKNSHTAKYLRERLSKAGF